MSTNLIKSTNYENKFISNFCCLQKIGGREYTSVFLNWDLNTLGYCKPKKKFLNTFVLFYATIFNNTSKLTGKMFSVVSLLMKLNVIQNKIYCDVCDTILIQRDAMK